ncbi:MAG: HtaA domain-containing protein [Candidatus Nanopelagicales bacterium]
MRKSAMRIAAVFVGGALLAPFAPAVAASNGISQSTLTWKIHECAFAGAFVTSADDAVDSCGSIREDQTTTGNVSKGADGWTFTGGVGTRDTATGESNVAFTGSVRLGNTSRGNYYVELRNPAVVVDGARSGKLTAEVVHKSPSSPDPVNAGRLLVADLPNVPNQDSWTVTPPWAGVGTPSETAPLDGKQFAAAFVDAVPSSLRNWFRASSSAAATDSRGEYNTHKTIASVTVDFGAADPVWNPQLQVLNADGIMPGETRTITVNGSGFNPALQGAPADGIYVVFGPNPAAIPNGWTDPNIFGSAQYLPQGPSQDGTFSTTLTVTGPYVDGNGVTWDPATTQFGVSTWAAHRRATTAWDSFAAISYTPAVVSPPVVPSAPRKVRAPKVVKVRGNKVTIKWGKPAAGTSPTGYKIRISKRNGKAFKKWKTVTNTKAVLGGVAKKGRYRVQIKAVGQGGASPAIGLVVRKR